jgi:hypothetical protein
MVRSILAPPRTTGGFIVAGAVVGVGLFMVVGLAVAIFRGEAGGGVTAETTSAPPQAALQPPEPVALPSAEPTASVDFSVDDLPLMPSASAAPAKKPNLGRGVPRVAAPRPSPKSTSGTPLSNPYKPK